MFSNKAKNSNHQADSNFKGQHTPDPWQSSLPEKKKTLISQPGNLFLETTPLIGSAEITDAPKLTACQSTSEVILLEEELKIKTSYSSLLKEQVKKALTLIFWSKSKTEIPSN